MTTTMLALFAISGILGGTTLACAAPHTKQTARIEFFAGVLFVGALAAIGFGLSSQLYL